MKNLQKFKSIALVMLISVLLTITLTSIAEAQDLLKTKGKKGVVVLKIKKDENGKTTVIDTTFNITTSGGQKEVEEYLKKHEKEFDDQSKEIENLELYVDMSDFSDSIINDSVSKYLRLIGRDIKSPHFRLQDRESGFDYDFDVPCFPDVSIPSFPGHEEYEGEFMPERDMRILRYDHKRQTLADMIGDIPMDRVKSYSIKEKKNGKRIIIDIEDSPH
jgi:hypothetical protein